ncbi:MAG: SDR family NAD(P)-dependent oxidoreductase [Methylobacter sp.]
MIEYSQGKAVLVVGASGGIGQSCVDLLALNGYTVFAGMRKSALPVAFGPGRGRIIPVALDIRSDGDVRQAFATIAGKLQDLELIGIVNCAGVTFPGPLARINADQMLDMLDINVVGQLRVVQAGLGLLRAGGRIVMIGSTSSRIPGVFTGGYSASKFALEALTGVLRAELADAGIDVVSVDPGMIGTAFWQKCADRTAAFLSDADNNHAALASWRQNVMAQSGNAAAPEQVAACVLAALTAKRPRPRYVVGLKAKLKLAVWPFLPESIKNAIIQRPLRRSVR